VVSKAANRPLTRSEVMARIRGRGNLSTEIKLASALRAHGVSGWRRQVRLRPWPAPEDCPPNVKKRRLTVTPDFVFWQQRLIVFVDGCFWHGCPLHGQAPKQDAFRWRAKLDANVSRDQRANRALTAAKWAIVRVWEHELEDDEGAVIARLKAALSVDPE
jgi:DNA mismatch endonuclease (patch repair protein)